MVKFRFRAPLSGFFLALQLTPAIGLAGGLQVQSGVPEGFDQLAAPRATVISLHYGGLRLGEFKADFTPTHLTLTQPEQAAAAVPDAADQPRLLAALRATLPAHSELLCRKQQTENCGTLRPETVGVIFDAERLSAELFINRSLLAVVQDDGPTYLPLPERSFAAVHALSGAVSGIDAAPPLYTFSAQSLLAYGEGALQSQTTLSNRGARFDTAALNVERRGWAARAGMFRSRSLELFDSNDIAGVDFGTSLRTRLDERRTEGNAIVLYLPRRAHVTLLRDGRVYSARLYEAGNQQVDTAELPEGAYTVTLRIQDADGTVREEKRFFARSENLPPPDTPDYFIQAGFIRQPASVDDTLPMVTPDLMLHAGTVRRVADNLGVGLDLVWQRDQGVGEGGVFWIYPDMQARLTAMGTTRGDFGVQASYLYQSGDWSMAADARRVWPHAANLPGDPDTLMGVTQGTLALNWQATEDVGFGVRGSYFAAENVPAVSAYGPTFDWSIWQEGESLLTFSANAVRADAGLTAIAGLRFSRRFGHSGLTGTAGNSMGADAAGWQGSLRAWHESETPEQAFLFGAGVAGDESNQNVNADAQWRNDAGRLQMNAQHGFGNAQHATAYGGNFAFNVAQNLENIEFGGVENGRSAVIIGTNGNGTGKMRIFVNSMAKGTVPIGGTRALYLSPFHSYRIRLVAESHELLAYDSGDRSVTLYPGNVVRQNWTIDRFQVVVARARLPNGTDLADAVLQEGRAQVATDSAGRFQAELTQPGVLHFTKPDGTGCAVTLPREVAPVNGVLLYREVLVCQPVSQTSVQP